jgi:hypothetical protein
MGTGSFPGVENGRGMTLTPHPLLVPRFKNRVELYILNTQHASGPPEHTVHMLKNLSQYKFFEHVGEFLHATVEPPATSY